MPINGLMIASIIICVVGMILVVLNRKSIFGEEQEEREQENSFPSIEPMEAPHTIEAVNRGFAPSAQVQKPQSDNAALESLEAKLKQKEELLTQTKELLKSMKDENERLSGEMENNRQKFKELQNNVYDLKEGVELTTSRENAKLHALEDQLQALAAEKNKFLQDQELVENFRKENEELQAKIKGTDDKTDELITQLEELKRVNDEKIKEAEEAVGALKQKESEQAPDEVSAERIGELETEANRLLQENADFVMNIDKVKEFNQNLLDKEKMLQYELTKSRAQAIGLEKVCEDFKIQIDQLSSEEEKVESEN